MFYCLFLPWSFKPFTVRHLRAWKGHHLKGLTDLACEHAVRITRVCSRFIPVASSAEAIMGRGDVIASAVKSGFSAPCRCFKLSEMWVETPPETWNPLADWKRREVQSVSSKAVSQKFSCSQKWKEESDDGGGFLMSPNVRGDMR